MNYGLMLIYIFSLLFLIAVLLLILVAKKR